MSNATKVLGWGKCSVKNGNSTFNDIVENSTQLSVEEGQEQEATIQEQGATIQEQDAMLRLMW